MKTNVLGYPRIGKKRELKKALESFWKEKISKDELFKVAEEQREYSWSLMKKNEIDYIPSNDFSFYDQVLDNTIMFGAIPSRFENISKKYGSDSIELYFAMARGYQKGNNDIIAMEMTKWFDTNYHYIVPELLESQQFFLNYNKPYYEFLEAKKKGIITKPVLISPVSYLLMSKSKESEFDTLALLDKLLPEYIKAIKQLVDEGVKTIQFDEPFLALNINDKIKDAISETYIEIRASFPELEIMVATYFEGVKDNTSLALSLPIDILHIDLVRAPESLNEVIGDKNNTIKFSLGLVDGRNIWKNEYKKSLSKIKKAIDNVGQKNIIIATSCSLLHCPYDLELETDERTLSKEIKNWLAFSKQKVIELNQLSKIIEKEEGYEKLLKENTEAIESKNNSELIHDSEVKKRVSSITEKDKNRNSVFSERKKIQDEHLKLPNFPTTTIGSFPQTSEIRKLRLHNKKGNITNRDYDIEIEKHITECIRVQEKIGLDVLVHGEFERNDMVEYFGEKLEGFIFSSNGWVQSYGSRGVKPPIIFGDVKRIHPLTVKWSRYAQSKTKRFVKGMLTGPITILQWSFVRNDQPRKDTAMQIALSIREEVKDLEKAGIKIIQIDEPAIREGLPLRVENQKQYLKWSIDAFKISSSGVEDKTQIHTHMCYSEFNEIIADIASMDADVITIETSRSQMELLNSFKDFKYPNEIGPGVYDIHSPRIPSKKEIIVLLEKALLYVSKDKLWVNPDCGLKTRTWDESTKALTNMILAAKEIRKRDS